MKPLGRMIFVAALILSAILGLLAIKGTAFDDIQEAHNRVQRAAASRMGTGRTVTLEPKKDVGATTIKAEELADVLRAGERWRRMMLRSSSPQVRKKLLAIEVPYAEPKEQMLQKGEIVLLMFDSSRIVQVIDKNTAIIGRNGRESVWAEGFSTDGATDGDSCEINCPVIVHGTKQYATVTGATKTILAIRPFVCDPKVLDEAKKLAKKPAGESTPASKRKAEKEQEARAAKAKRKPDEARAPKFRTWTDASGKFKITAKLKSAIAGNVELEREDGTVVTVPIDKLSEEDQAYLKKRAR